MKKERITQYNRIVNTYFSFIDFKNYEEYILPRNSKPTDAEFQELKSLLMEYGLINIKLFYRLVQINTSKLIGWTETPESNYINIGQTKEDKYGENYKKQY